MKPGDLIKVNRQLFWRTGRPSGAFPGCLALVLEVWNGLTPSDTVDAQSWNAMVISSHGARLMIGDTPYLILLDPTDVEVLNASR
jgi:hypothetical protein